MRKAIFSGLFDSITLGHEDIIRRGIPLFDEIVIAIGVNADKKYMLSLEDENVLMKKLSKRADGFCHCLRRFAIELCQKIKVNFILRGLRNPADFEFEKAIAYTKR